MDTLLYLLLLAAGVGVLVKSADWFTEAAVEIARRMRVPELIVGATLVSMATTLPEFAVSFAAALQGRASWLAGDMALMADQVGMAVGNAVGSTICNVGLILGLCALLSPMAIEQRAFRRNGLILLILASIFTSLAYIFPNGSLWVGAIMLAGLCAYLVSIVRGAAPSDLIEEIPEPRGLQLKMILLLFGVGAGGVVLGSKLVVYCAEELALQFGVPQIIVALTLVALGTSMPELTVSLAAIIKNQRGISIGNVIGANILNLAWVLGACSAIVPLPLTQQTLRLDLPMMLSLSVLLLIFGSTGKRLARWEGAFLLTLYLAYVATMFVVYGNSAAG